MEVSFFVNPVPKDKGVSVTVSQRTTLQSLTFFLNAEDVEPFIEALKQAAREAK